MFTAPDAPQAKNTVTLGHQNSPQNPQTGTTGMHNVTYILHNILRADIHEDDSVCVRA